MLRSLISASVRFRSLLIAVAAGVMALAVAAVPGIHADVLPETAPVTARIQTEAPGLSPPEVESLVTVPLEKNLLERSEEHTSELQSHVNLVCRLLLEKKN